MRVAFLHFPKTAGQSVHNSLIKEFDVNKICPARLNAQLYKYSIEDLEKFDLFSGHLDWSYIQKSGKFDYVFTVLRDPKERILSFYFYLRKEAQRFLSNNEEVPVNILKSFTLTPKDYFCSQNQNFSKFIKNHYDNFYAYYFATGSFSGNSIYEKQKIYNKDKILKNALEFLDILDGIYFIENLNKLEEDLKILFNKEVEPFMKLNINEESKSSERIRDLKLLSKEWNFESLLDEFTDIDYKLCDYIKHTKLK